MLICALYVTVSTFTSNLAIKLTSFPNVMMIKSCSILPVVCIGVLFSKVKDDSLKIGVDKVAIALLISFGIAVYNFGGDNLHDDKNGSLVGIGLLIVSLLADGFLSDYQAVLKS
jgi:drug/metabolite transporter (DMT)-like permease